MAGKQQRPFGQLRVRHVRTSVDGPPNRRLLVDVEIHSADEIHVVILGVWSEARLEPGGIVASGALFEQQHALHRRAVLAPGGRVLGRFTVPVTAESLTATERDRTDGVTLTVSGRILVAPVVGIDVAASRIKKRVESEGSHPPTTEPIVGAPFEVLAGDESGRAMLTLPIPASEWIKLLRAWRWREIELFELGLSARTEPPHFAHVYTILRQAEQSFLDHDFEGTLSHCRRGLESMAASTGESNISSGYSALLAGKFGGAIMTENFDKILKAVTTFAHAGRHARHPHEPVNRDDAHFVLRSTLAVVERLTR